MKKTFSHALRRFHLWGHFWLGLVFTVGSLNASGSSTVPFDRTMSSMALNRLDYGPYDDLEYYYMVSEALRVQGTRTISNNTLTVTISSLTYTFKWSGVDDVGPGMGSQSHMRPALKFMIMSGSTVMSESEYIRFDNISPTLSGNTHEGVYSAPSSFLSNWTFSFDLTGIPAGSDFIVRGFVADPISDRKDSLICKVGPQVEQCTRLLAFPVYNPSDAWVSAGIFVTEFPGIMLSRVRVGPGASADLTIRVLCSDTYHYYAAVVDPVASSGAREITTVVDDGSSFVSYDGVVEKAGTASSTKTAADGEDVPEAGPGGGGYVAPNQIVFSPSVPARTTTTGTAVAATNEHLSEVGNAVAKTIEDGLKALQGTAERGVSASGAAQRSVDSLGSSLTDISAKLDALTPIRDLAVLQKSLSDTRPTEGEMSAAGDAAATYLGGVLSAGPSSLGYSAPTDAAPSLAVAMPVSFGGKTFDLNPFSSERFGGVVAWYRSAVAWLVIVSFGALIWKELAAVVGRVASAPQAKGNAVVAGTGAQATAMAAAITITAAVSSAVVALLGWSFGEITFPAILSAASSSPLSTMPSGIYWMLNQLLPVWTIISALVGRLTFQMWALHVYAVASSIIRFVVP